MKLAELHNEVIELELPVPSPYHESLVVAGRVFVCLGDRDGPPHIKLGASILPETARVIPTQWINDRYTLELP